MSEDADDPFARARTHQALLSDRVRTLAYRRALEAAVRPDDVVLDLGCGTGIFSMIAARRGCRKVYAVDRSAILDDARETARRTGSRAASSSYAPPSISSSCPSAWTSSCTS